MINQETIELIKSVTGIDVTTSKGTASWANIEAMIPANSGMKGQRLKAICQGMTSGGRG